jgi:CTP synthase (UTP-ammonia lyase)
MIPVICLVMARPPSARASVAEWRRGARPPARLTIAPGPPDPYRTGPEEEQPVTPLVGVVGDYRPDNHTHRATDMALADAGIHFEWVPTTDVAPDRPQDRLGHCAGILIAPSSPYRSMEGALAAVRLARERGVPLVGT